MLCSISNVMISTEIAFLPSVARSNEKRISLPAEEYSEKKIYRNDIKLAQPKQHNHPLDVIPAKAGIHPPFSSPCRTGNKKLDSCSRIPPKNFTGRNDILFTW